MKLSLKLFYSIILVIFIFNNFFLINKIRKVKHTSQTKIFELQNNINKLNSRVDILLFNMKEQISFEDNRINKKIVVTTLNKEKKNLTVLINDNILIFIMPFESCSPCYENLLNKFSLINRYIGQQNFIMLVPLQKFRDYNDFFKNNISISLYAYEKDEFKLTINNNYTPSFFVTDKALLIKHLYIPDINNLDITEKYFQAISEKYFKDDIINL